MEDPLRNFDYVARHGKGKFAPHGQLENVKTGQIVTQHAVGPFNAEFITAYRTLWAKRLKEWVECGPFVLVTEWHNSLLASPDTVKAARDLNALGAKYLPKGTLHVWQIASDVEAREIMIPLWLATMTDNHMYVIVCDSATETAMVVQRFLQENPSAKMEGGGAA
jgi:hypothetical protein